jgi:signal transduction histidine kinase
VFGEFEAVLRRIGFVARLVGLLWWVALSGLVLSASPVWPSVTLGLGVLWAAVTTILYLRNPGWTTAAPVLAVDLALAVFAVLAERWAATGVLFYGGFPLIVVVVAAIRSRKAAWTTATALAVVVGARVGETSTPGFAFNLSQIVVYLAGAAIATWAFDVLRRSDAEIQAARESLTRAEERSEISRHLHDSVLQTLALIQRAADNPGDVVGLARRQERELRGWLYGSPELEAGSLFERIRETAADVEERYGVPVEVVTVGEPAPGPALDALNGAAREALINAVKHSGAPAVSVYVEAQPDLWSVYVRDRGSGFDPAEVTAERRGISDSIIARMARAGGRASLRTEPGKGTEWQLEVGV